MTGLLTSLSSPAYPAFCLLPPASLPKMSEQTIQEKIQELANQAITQGNPSSWFETVYAQSQGDANQVPWAKLTSHPHLQDWLDVHPPSQEPSSALVIGCGLGDDAEALAQKQYHVTAFDISPTAVSWCQQRFPDSSVNYIVADLLAIPSQWHQSFNLVFECRNIQALPLNVRSQAIESVASMVAVGGTLLVITGFRETEDQPDGPPWLLSESEISQFTKWGLTEISRFSFSTPNRPYIRIEYQRRSPTS